MQLANLKIGVRLGLLGGFFFIALLVVGVGGWSALNDSNARSGEAMTRSVALTEAIDTARSAQVEFKIQVQEWKNTLLRGNEPAAFEKYSKAFSASGETTRKELEKLNRMLLKLELRTALVDEAVKTHAGLGVSYLAALKQYDPANGDSAHVVDALVKGMDRAPTKQIDEIVAFIGAQSRRLMQEMAQENARAHRNATLAMLATVLLTLAVGAATVLWLINSITRPLRAAVGLAKDVMLLGMGSHFEIWDAARLNDNEQEAVAGGMPDVLSNFSF